MEGFWSKSKPVSIPEPKHPLVLSAADPGQKPLSPWRQAGREQKLDAMHLVDPQAIEPQAAIFPIVDCSKQQVVWKWLYHRTLPESK